MAVWYRCSVLPQLVGRTGRGRQMKLNSLVAWSLPGVQLVRSGLGTCQGREKQGQTSGGSEGSGLHVAWR